MAKQEDLMTPMSKAELSELIAKEAAKLAAKQVDKVKVASMSDAERAAMARNEQVMAKAKAYGDKVMDVMFHVSDGSTERDFAITDDGLKQICFQACRAAADGHHFCRDRIRDTREKLDGTQEEAGIGARRWNIASDTGVVDPRRGDEQVTEFEPTDKALERTLRYYLDKSDQLEVIGMMFEYIDVVCLDMKEQKNEALRAEGQKVPEASNGWAASFDVSDKAFARWLNYRNKNRQQKTDAKREASQAATGLELKTRPLGVKQDESVDA